jgi:hypothetical protein
MDTRKQIDIDKIVQAFLMQMPGKHQAEAAKLLNIPRKRFNDYYNHRYNPSERLLLQMESYLHARGNLQAKAIFNQWLFLISTFSFQVKFCYNLRLFVASVKYRVIF